MLCPCRVLEALWELLLQAILQALGTNLDVSSDFYSRFHFTLEVGPCAGATLLGCRGKGCCPPLDPAAPGQDALACQVWTTLSLSPHQGISSLPAHLAQHHLHYLLKQCLASDTSISPSFWGLLLCPWHNRLLCLGSQDPGAMQTEGSTCLGPLSPAHATI